MMQPVGLDSISELEKFILAQNGGLSLPAQQSMIISCPKKMVGRVIGKNGETIKALQQFTGAQIQIDQRSDPTRVSIAGAPKAMQMATSMVQDIVAGTFKGFAMLRSYATQATKSPGALELLGQPAPVYVEGYGFIPPSQFSDVSEPFGYSQLQGYGNDQVPNHASLNALSQLYNMQNPQDLGMVMPNAPQQYNGMDPSSQQAHMASIARSLFESSELKASNGGHHGLMPSSQPEHSTGGYPAMSLGMSNWSQTQALSSEEGALKHSPQHSPVQSPSRNHSPGAGNGVRAATSTPKEPPTLAAQLQALSLLSTYQDKQTAPSEASQHSARWPPASHGNGNGNGTASPSAPLPHGWMQLTDPEKRTLYHNYLTGHTQYKLPTADQGAGSGSLGDGEKPGALGQRSSAPLGTPNQHSSDSMPNSLGHRLSGPAAFSGGVSQQGNGAEAQPGALEAQSSAMEVHLASLGQRLPESEFKIGNRLPPTGLFQ